METLSVHFMSLQRLKSGPTRAFQQKSHRNVNEDWLSYLSAFLPRGDVGLLVFIRVIIPCCINIDTVSSPTRFLMQGPWPGVEHDSVKQCSLDPLFSHV